MRIKSFSRDILQLFCNLSDFGCGFFGTMVYCTRMNPKSIPYCSWGAQCDWPIKKRGWLIQSKCNKVFFFCPENQNKASSLHHCLELHLKNHMPLWDRMVIIVLILYGPILWLNNSANGIPDFPFLSISPSKSPHSSIVLFSTGQALRLWIIQMGQ